MSYKEALSYDDVLIIPAGVTDVKSRWDCQTRSQLALTANIKQTLQPLIASPMSTVCDVDMCVEMSRLGCLGILHRGHPYEDIKNKIEAIYKIHSVPPISLFGVAIGSQDKDLEDAKTLLQYGVKILCVDVANGHNKHVAKFVEKLKNLVGQKCHIMAGNVATPEGFKLLATSGADSVRVGISGGASCATAVNTAVGMPTLQSIIDCAEWRDVNHLNQISIIADGGAKSSGDIAKAIAAGADFVMCGSLFAGTSRSPGKLLWKLDDVVYDEQPKRQVVMSVPGHNTLEAYVPDTRAIQVKKYEGMASFNVQVEQGRDETKIIPEGVSTYVKYSGETSEMVKLLLGGLRSAMSYCNATTLEQFRLNAEFIRVTGAGLAESRPHAVYRL